MTQQIGRILNQALRQVWKYVTTDPTFRMAMIRVLSTSDVGKMIDKKISETIEQVWIAITSTKITIRSGDTQVEFEAQSIIKHYSIGDVKNSTILQGENIVPIKNYSFHFHLYGNNTAFCQEVCNVLKTLNEESFKLGQTTLEKEQIQQINNNIYIHGENLQDIAYLKLQIIPNV